MGGLCEGQVPRALVRVSRPLPPRVSARCVPSFLEPPVGACGAQCRGQSPGLPASPPPPTPPSSCPQASPWVIPNRGGLGPKGTRPSPEGQQVDCGDALRLEVRHVPMCPLHPSLPGHDHMAPSGRPLQPSRFLSQPGPSSGTGLTSPPPGGFSTFTGARTRHTWRPSSSLTAPPASGRSPGGPRLCSVGSLVPEWEAGDPAVTARKAGSVGLGAACRPVHGEGVLGGLMGGSAPQRSRGHWLEVRAGVSGAGP